MAIIFEEKKTKSSKKQGGDIFLHLVPPLTKKYTKRIFFTTEFEVQLSAPNRDVLCAAFRTLLDKFQFILVAVVFVVAQHENSFLILLFFHLANDFTTRRLLHLRFFLTKSQS